MLALFLFIAFGIVFGYFATLNTGLVSVHFGTTTIPSIPLYLLVLVSLGLGVLFASLFYGFKSLGIRFFLGRKESEISHAKKDITELTRQVHQLELENTKLKTKLGEESGDDSSL
jgi:uncharacterized integral membrane protein